MANNKEKMIKSVLDMKKAMADFFDSYVDMLMSVPVLNANEVTELKVAEPVEKKTPAKKAKSKPAKTEVEDDVEETEETGDGYTREYLDGIKYNELKKIAKELGISAKGDRETLVENILNVSETEETTEVDDDFEEDDETTTEGDFDDEEEDDGEVEDVEEEPVDDTESLAEEVRESVSELETEEIADILVEAGISAKGKREALIDKLIKAVQDGAVTLEDVDEEDDTEEVEEVEEVDNDEDNSETDADEEDVNDPNSPNMTVARKKAIKSLRSMLEKKYDDGKLKVATIKKTLKAYYDESADEIDEMDNEELLDAYIELKCLFIDDDGDEVDEGTPYDLNGNLYCCGQPLQYNEDDNTYICEVCGSEYEQ